MFFPECINLGFVPPPPKFPNYDGSFIKIDLRGVEDGRLVTALFDNPRLPDLIIGTEAMSRWGDRWYFIYTSQGEIITVQRDSLVSSGTS